MQNPDKRVPWQLNETGLLNTVRVEKSARFAVAMLTTGETIRFPLPPAVLEAPFETRISAQVTESNTEVEWPTRGDFHGYKLSISEILTHKNHR